MRTVAVSLTARVRGLGVCVLPSCGGDGLASLLAAQPRGLLVSLLARDDARDDAGLPGTLSGTPQCETPPYDQWGVSWRPRVAGLIDNTGG